jgi:Caspase domain
LQQLKIASIHFKNSRQMSKKTNVFGLFVGIDAYREDIVLSGGVIFPALGGCVADVTAVRELLSKDENVNLVNGGMLLTDKAATKPAIVGGFEDYLSKAKKDDIAFVYYAGHGGLEKADPKVWTSETDGALEGVVCYYDKPDVGKLMLADKELRYLLNRLWARTKAHIVVMFDCCHSGDNTRSVTAHLTPPSASGPGTRVRAPNFPCGPGATSFFQKNLNPNTSSAKALTT